VISKIKFKNGLTYVVCYYSTVDNDSNIYNCYNAKNISTTIDKKKIALFELYVMYNFRYW